MTYEFYAESEWRVLFFEELLHERKIVDPRQTSNAKEHDYFMSLTDEQQTRLKCLVPLDGWLAVIIYPSLQVKNLAQWEDSSGVRSEIQRIKTHDDHGNHVEGIRNPLRGNWPIEVNLDACAHF